MLIASKLVPESPDPITTHSTDVLFCVLRSVTLLLQDLVARLEPVMMELERQVGC